MLSVFKIGLSVRNAMYSHWITSVRQPRNRVEKYETK